MSTPDTKITNSDIADFLDFEEDTRRVVMRALGMPKRRIHRYSELWVAIGLAPEQPDFLWPALVLGADRKNHLWGPERVAEEVGCATDTVNGYCRTGKFPDGFPRPLFDLAPRQRRWLPLDVRAYTQPSLFGRLSKRLKRKSISLRSGQDRSASMPRAGSLQPLPPKT